MKKILIIFAIIVSVVNAFAEGVKIPDAPVISEEYNSDNIIFADWRPLRYEFYTQSVAPSYRMLEEAIDDYIAAANKYERSKSTQNIRMLEVANMRLNEAENRYYNVSLIYRDVAISKATRVDWAYKQILAEVNGSRYNIIGGFISVPKGDNINRVVSAIKNYKNVRDFAKEDPIEINVFKVNSHINGITEKIDKWGVHRIEYANAPQRKYMQPKSAGIAAKQRSRYTDWMETFTVGKQYRELYHK